MYTKYIQYANVRGKDTYDPEKAIIPEVNRPPNYTERNIPI